MNGNIIQMPMFDEMIEKGEKIDNTLAAQRRIVRINEELRVGDWDYERLLPDQKHYEETVKEFRGATSFNSPAMKYRVTEARAIVRFLKTWITRREALEARREVAEAFIIKERNSI